MRMQRRVGMENRTKSQSNSLKQSHENLFQWNSVTRAKPVVLKKEVAELQRMLGMPESPMILKGT